MDCKRMHSDLFQNLDLPGAVLNHTMSGKQQKRKRNDGTSTTPAQHKIARRIMSRYLKAEVATAIIVAECTPCIQTMRHRLTETFGEQRMQMHATIVLSLLNGFPAIVEEWSDLLPFDTEYGVPTRGKSWNQGHTCFLEVFAAGMPTVQEVEALPFPPTGNRAGTEADVDSDNSNNDQNNPPVYLDRTESCSGASSVLKRSFANWWNEASKQDVMVQFGPKQGPREIANVMKICDNYNRAALITPP